MPKRLTVPVALLGNGANSITRDHYNNDDGNDGDHEDGDDHISEVFFPLYGKK